MSFINYKIKGEGLPVIFLHGFCETSETWNPFVAEISSNYQSITLDLPGFGSSQLSKTDASLADIATDLNKWVLDQGLDNPIVLGHSLGGYVSLAMVNQMPTLYSAFGLIHATAKADSDEKRLSRTKVMTFVKEYGVKAFVDSFVPSLYYQKDHPSIEFAHKIALKTNESTFLTYTAAMRDRPSRVDCITNFTNPILMVGGQNDPLIPIGSLEEQAALNGRISIYMLPRVGHMGMFEAESELVEIVNNFVFVVENGLMKQ